MKKRLELVVRNPGFEQSENALGVYSLDFEDGATLGRALVELHHRLRELTPTNRLIYIFVNERGEERGVDLQYYVSHSLSDIDNWEPPAWSLPKHGENPPSRED